MNTHLSKVLSILFLLLFAGCAASTLDSAMKKGATVLSNEEIYSLVNSNTLRLVASNFDAHVFFSPDGYLSASSILSHNLDDGKWDIKSDQRLCLKFGIWYYGDVNCYDVYRDRTTDDYLLFSKNGSLVYTAKATSGNSQHLDVKSQKDKTVFVRSSISKGESTSSYRPSVTPAVTAAATAAPSRPNTGPGASQEEITHTVKTMARDCPGCNFEDADLRQANLVGANLKGANLRGADLSRANLRRANLAGADLKGATLLSTNLPGANLKGADLTGADLSGSNLIQADFSGAEMKNTILDNTLQEGTKGLQ